MTDDIQAAGETMQELVAVPKHHLHPGWIPESVLISLTEVNGAHYVHVPVVDALPVEFLEIELENLSNIVVRVVSGFVFDGLLALDPNDGTR